MPRTLPPKKVTNFELRTREHLFPDEVEAYLGHKNIQHTVCYTELSPKRFKDFWSD